MDDQPKKPKIPEVPSPPDTPEVPPGQEPMEPMWPRREPEVIPQKDTDSPRCPDEIPPPPGGTYS